MLPLRLVKTPHKILSMNLTIKFKQFLSLAWAAVGAGACDDVVCCCGDKAGGKRNGGNGRGEAVGLAAACATEMNVQVFMGRKTCIVSCVCMRGTADFVFCGTAAVVDDVYQSFLNEK